MRSRGLNPNGAMTGVLPEDSLAAQNLHSEIHYHIGEVPGFETETAPPDSEAAPRQRGEAGPFSIVLLKLSAAVLVAAGGLVVAKNIAPDIGFDTETSSAGNARLTDVRFSDPTYQVGQSFEMFSTRVEDDAPGFAQNPYGDSKGETLKTLKFNTEYPVSAKLVYDDELAKILPEYAVYVYVSTYDAEGNDMGFNTGDVEVEAIRPESCWIKNDDAGYLKLDGCKDEDDPEFRGGFEPRASDGGWVNSDGSMPEKDGAVRATFWQNGYCVEAGIFGGPYEEYRDNGYKFDKDNIPLPDDETLYENEMMLVKAAIRSQAGDWFNSPLGLVFFPAELKLLKQDPEAFKTKELAAAQSTFDHVDPSLINSQEYDDPLAVELSDLDVADINYGYFWPGIGHDTPYEQLEKDPRNYSVCFPVSDKAKEYTEETFETMHEIGVDAWMIKKDTLPNGEIKKGYTKAWQDAMLEERQS